MSRIGGILLAAGAASRFGTPKQAARIGERETLLQRSVAYLADAKLAAWVVVLGAHADGLTALLAPDIPRVLNRHWSDGMLGSLQTGLRFLLAQTEELDGIFVMAGDQPDFSTEQIGRYLRAARAKGAVRPVVTDYGGKYGLPFVLPQSNFAAILALPRAGHLRPLLQGLDQAVVLAEGPHLRDIDTRNDLDDWLAEQG